MDQDRMTKLLSRYGNTMSELAKGPTPPLVEVYSKKECPHCVAAKELLVRLGQAVVEYDIEVNPTWKSEWRKRSKGRNTVPQIFINGEHIGGNDDLQASHRSGRLGELLNGGP